MDNKEQLAQLYRAMSVIELSAFEKAYCAAEYAPEAQSVIAQVLAERRQELGAYRKAVGDSGERIVPLKAARLRERRSEFWNLFPIGVGVAVGGSIAQAFHYESFCTKSLLTALCCGFFAGLGGLVEFLFHRFFPAKNRK